MMQVFINGTAVDCPEGFTLADLLKLRAMTPTSCATAVNGQFVARQSRGDVVLSPDDHIMTFEPITGG